jgi:hypothetical protein
MSADFTRLSFDKPLKHEAYMKKKGQRKLEAMQMEYECRKEKIAEKFKNETSKAIKEQKERFRVIDLGNIDLKNMAYEDAD